MCPVVLPRRIAMTWRVRLKVKKYIPNVKVKPLCGIHILELYTSSQYCCKQLLSSLSYMSASD